MRWYVIRAGQTTGPIEEPELVRLIQSGMVDAHIRDEAGGAWMPVGQSPFAQFAARSAAAGAPPPSTSPRPQPSAPPSEPFFWSTPAGRGAILAAIIMVLLVSARGSFGLVMGGVLMAWGIVGYRRGLRTPLERVLGRPAARWVGVTCACLGGLLIALSGSVLVGESRANREATERALEARRAAEAREKQAAEQRAAMAAQIPSKAAAWRAELGRIANDFSGGGAVNEGRLREGVAAMAAVQRDTEPWLAQFDRRAAPDLYAAAAEVDGAKQRLETILNLITTVGAIDASVKKGSELAAQRSWLAADSEWDSALAKIAEAKKVNADFGNVIRNGFEPDKLKAKVTSLKAGIASGVATEKRRLKKEEEQRAKDEAYAALCGPAPVVGAWDGELVGLERALKETANDPDSIDVENCTQPVLTKGRCWMSTCNVRGKNAFGALILLRKTYAHSKLGYEEVD